ncbi:MAG: DUF488 domain-containing protein [Candidatus Riflebacteria bacterium]|nr:DUF488 domain-containing protein [Candidatus Riflebacteria bacterium]
MYYRRKYLLALLERFNRSLDKIAMQKLLFLLVQNSARRQFDFVPYKYGCFSFQANYDLTVMNKLGQLAETETHWSVSDKSNYLPEIRSEDRLAIEKLFQDFSKLEVNQLTRHTYIHFPLFATRSLLAKKLLTKAEYNKVEELTSQKLPKTLFTIGYEGRSFDDYLLQLVEKRVHTLFDVRKNALSMKYGFSKTTLKNACESLGIKYIHLPDLGISSDRRQSLNSQEDYDRIFLAYEKEVLPVTLNSQTFILETLDTNNRVAITCFEKDLEKCHRTRLAIALKETTRGNLEIEHL